MLTLSRGASLHEVGCGGEARGSLAWGRVGGGRKGLAKHDPGKPLPRVGGGGQGTPLRSGFRNDSSGTPVVGGGAGEGRAPGRTPNAADMAKGVFVCVCVVRVGVGVPNHGGAVW